MLRFILFLILFYIIYKVLQYFLRYLISPSKSKRDSFRRSSNTKSKYENVEDAEFKEINPDENDKKEE
jgi:hypothetical protein